MQAKLFFLAALFVASFANTDSASTPNILISNWTLTSTVATPLSPCCQPTGNVVITGNPDNTATLTSTNWTGAECNNRNSSFQEIIEVDWSDSFQQLESTYHGSGILPLVYDTNDTNITINMYFLSSGTTLSLVYDNNVDECYTLFAKSGSTMRVLAGVLIAYISLVIA